MSSTIQGRPDRVAFIPHSALLERLKHDEISALLAITTATRSTTAELHTPSTCTCSKRRNTTHVVLDFPLTSIKDIRDGYANHNKQSVWEVD